MDRIHKTLTRQGNESYPDAQLRDYIAVGSSEYQRWFGNLVSPEYAMMSPGPGGLAI